MTDVKRAWLALAAISIVSGCSANSKGAPSPATSQSIISTSQTSSPATQTTPTAGIISGIVLESGGPYPGTPRPAVADITVSGVHDYTNRSGQDGRYELTVPPGNYHVTAALIGGYPCQPTR